jgi:four helix bundle protein
MHHMDSPLWLKAMTLAVEVHRLTAHLPKQETFGLTSQMRRAAVSIVSNIAEGAARRTSKEFVSFLHISRGSQAELETQLLLTVEFGYVPRDVIDATLGNLHEIGRLTTSTIRRLAQH